MFTAKKPHVIFDDRLDHAVSTDCILYDDNLEHILYVAEGWGKCNDDEYVIISFDDIRSFFDAWDPEDHPEYPTVYDYIRDCIGNGFHPVREICDPDTFECRFTGKSGADIIVDRYGQDDYSASWDDSYSVRGTFAQIMEELKEEI